MIDIEKNQLNLLFSNTKLSEILDCKPEEFLETIGSVPIKLNKS